MTGDELERAMEFLLQQQATLASRVAATDENLKRLEHTVERVVQEAAADRAEVRSAVSTILTVAESMADNVKLLTEAQIATSRRVDGIETRVDRLEGR